jgi:hypothetical protein
LLDRDRVGARAVDWGLESLLEPRAVREVGDASQPLGNGEENSNDLICRGSKSLKFETIVSKAH